MPKQATKINTKTARLSLPIRTSEPYWHSISKGLAVGYYKGERSSTWVARHFSTETGRQKAALGSTDDSGTADGVHILSFDQAQTAANEWRARLKDEHSGAVTSGLYTVAMAMDDYIGDSERAKRKKLPRTRLVIESHIKPALGKLDLRKLTHGRVKAWRDSLATNAPRVRTAPGKPQAYREIDFNDPQAQRARQATANRILTVLKAGLNHAKSENRRIATDAAWADVKPYKGADSPKVRFLTMDEVSKLAPACEAAFQKLIKGALLSGCRYGELTAMLVGNFDKQHGTLFVADSKNGESRYVSLNDEGNRFFAHLTSNRGEVEHMFLKANGKCWKTSEQQRPMDEACQATGITGVTFHILRHTYASHAVMNGMPIRVLADNLGHKDTRITERHYAHLSRSYKQEVIRANAPSFGFQSGLTLVIKSA